MEMKEEALKTDHGVRFSNHHFVCIIIGVPSTNDVVILPQISIQVQNKKKTPSKTG